jgi:hypothetical protein
VDTYLLDGSKTLSNGGGGGGGPLVDVGGGLALSPRLDIRVEVPVLVWFSGLVSIPLVVGVIYRF